METGEKRGKWHGSGKKAGEAVLKNRWNGWGKRVKKRKFFHRGKGRRGRRIGFVEKEGFFTGFPTQEMGKISRPL